MRWIALFLLLGVLLAAGACGEDGGTSDENATPTPGRVVPAATPMVTADYLQLPTAEPVTEKDAQLLRSLAPTADEVGRAFADLAPFEQELSDNLGQEYEHVDLAGHGFVAGYAAFYRRPPDESYSAYMTFALFRESSGASDALREMIALEFGEASTFEISEGDESHGLLTASEGDALELILLRQGRVVAFFVVQHPNGEDRREGMRQLARNVAARSRSGLAQ